MSRKVARGLMWQEDGRWRGRLERPSVEVAAVDRGRCLRALRRAAGDSPLTVEVIPALVGVAEAAAILGWDKRRVSTYVRRGSFPEALASLASGRVWRREDVEAYALAWRSRRRRAMR